MALECTFGYCGRIWNVLFVILEEFSFLFPQNNNFFLPRNNMKHVFPWAVKLSDNYSLAHIEHTPRIVDNKKR